jgi:hypothetical protein
LLVWGYFGLKKPEKVLPMCCEPSYLGGIKIVYRKIDETFACVKDAMTRMGHKQDSLPEALTLQGQLND